MGIVNVTPDSFSDGGLWLDHDDAVAHGRELVAEGAAVLDVGGGATRPRGGPAAPGEERESTRPGAEPVAAGEELRRVVPVIERLTGAGAGAGAQLSIDTTKAV